jgi:hypothetical protein
MTGPGKPLSPIINPYLKVPGRDRYVNIYTGESVTRAGYRNIVAQKYGFRNAHDYDQLSSQLNGIGGLGGLAVKDVQRARNIVRKYERDHGMVRGTFGIESRFLQAQDVRSWLVEPPGKRRDGMLNRMLDVMGVWSYKPDWNPGESP